MLQLAHLKVTQLKLGAFQPRVCHWFIGFNACPAQMPDGLAKKAGEQSQNVGFIYILITYNSIYTYNQIIIYSMNRKANLYNELKNFILINIY